MTTIEFFAVHQMTDERNSKVLGCFSSELLATTIAAENPGWYSAQSWVTKEEVVIYEDIWDWIGMSQPA